MSKPKLVANCDPPGGQRVLFLVPSDRAPVYSVIDRDGYIRVRTSTLGVALAVARRVVLEHGEVWLRSSDDTSAHVDAGGVRSETSERPWIASVADSLEA